MDGLLSPAQRTAKVIYELLSQYYWLYNELLVVIKSARGDRETSRYRAECGLGLTDKKIERRQYHGLGGGGGEKFTALMVPSPRSSFL